MLKKIKFRSLNIDITSVIIDDAWGFKLNSEKYHFNFRGWLSCNMSGSNAKKSMIKWHTGWLGETDANGDLVGDWAQYFDQEQFKCRYCNLERKYSNGGRSSLIQHSQSGKHQKIADGKKGRVAGQQRVQVEF